MTAKNTKYKRVSAMKQKIEQNKRFFDVWAGTYDFSLFQFWMRGFHKPVFREIDVARKGKVLDISCGTGELLRELVVRNRAGNLSLKGADISEKMLAVARKKLPTAVELEQENVLELNEKSNTYDYVTSTESFHHYPHQKQALQEMVRVTKKKGKVIIVDINFFVRFVHWLFEKLEPGCVKVNSKREMRTLFEDAGLNDVRQERSFLFAVMTRGVK